MSTAISTALPDFRNLYHFSDVSSPTDGAE